MRKKGAKGAPKASDFAAAKRTAKKATGGPVGKVVKGIKKTTKPKRPKPKGPSNLDRFTPPSSYPGKRKPRSYAPPMERRTKPKKKKQIKSYEGFA